MSPHLLVGVAGALALAAPIFSQENDFHPGSEFVENRGQWSPDARFRAAFGPVTAWIREDGWVLECRDPRRSRAAALRMTFDSIGSLPTGELPQPTRFSWIRGTDPSNWIAGARSFDRVRLPAVADGVDVVIRDGGGYPEYDLLVEPGASLADLRVRCDGTEGLRIDADGTLVLETSLGPLRQPSPDTWEVLADGSRGSVDCRYVLHGDRTFGFAADGWSGATPLVVDPGLVWSTYLGGSADDVVLALDVAPNGETVVCGTTESGDLPTTTGALQTGYIGRSSGGGTGDAFVARLSADGSRFLFVTYLGGSSGDEARAIVVDAQGEITVAGSTWSADFPVTSDAFRMTRGNRDDGFVARLDAAGGALLYGTYYGGNGFDEVFGLTVDRARDRIVISGTTRSSDLPTTAGAFQTSLSTSVNAFLAILDRRTQPGSTLVEYATYLGGTDGSVWVDAGPHHVDAGGIVTLSGVTYASDHPTTPGAFQTTRSGRAAGFVTRLDPSQQGASALVYSTYVGGSGSEFDCIAQPDSAGMITVAGSTQSQDMPTTASGFQPTVSGAQRSGFLSRLDPTQQGAAALRYGTYLYGTRTHVFDRIRTLAVADGGIALVGGQTGSDGFPETAGAFQRPRRKGGGALHGFLTLFDTTAPGAQGLLYSTAVESCGNRSDEVLAVHYDHASRAATVGGRTGDGFAISAGAPQAAFGGGLDDGFVTRVELRALPPSTTRFGQGCAGTAGIATVEPDLDAQLCSRYRIRFTGMRLASSVFVFLGFSRSTYAGLPLPLPLDSIGMAGCTLLVSGELSVSIPTGTGAASWSLNIPGDTRLLGQRFYNQGFVIDPGANALGVVSTNAIEAEIRW